MHTLSIAIWARRREEKRKKKIEKRRKIFRQDFDILSAVKNLKLETLNLKL